MLMCLQVCVCTFVHVSLCVRTYTQSRDNFCGVSSIFTLSMWVLGLELSLAGLSSHRGLYPLGHRVSRK